MQALYMAEAQNFSCQNSLGTNHLLLNMLQVFPCGALEFDYIVSRGSNSGS